MYIRIGKEDCHVAHLKEGTGEVELDIIKGESEWYSDKVLSIVLERYPIVEPLYDTVKEKLESEEEPDILNGSYQEYETKKGRKPKVKTGVREETSRERLKGILDYINNNYLSKHYGKLIYEGVKGKDYLTGSNIVHMRNTLEDSVSTESSFERQIKVKDGSGICLDTDNGKRLCEDSIAFVIRTLILKNNLNQIRIGKEGEVDTTNLAELIRGKEGYMFIDFGTDIYIIK